MDGVFNWFLEPFRKYADFKGRARRKEYWTFAIGIGIINAILSIFTPKDGSFSAVTIITIIVGFAILVPSLAVAIRRLHDIGKSGWSILFGLIPIAGGIIMLIWYLKDSQPGTNEYGPNPKA